MSATRWLAPPLALEIADGVVVGIGSVVNPEKLGHLGPVSDLARRR